MPSEFRCISPDPQFVGDPIDTLSGANIESALDFQLTGPLELRWIRHYSSASVDRCFALGWGHNHDFDRTLRFDLDGLSYLEPLGQRTGFPPLQNNGEQFSSGALTLRRLSRRRFELHEQDKPTMVFDFSDERRPAQLIALQRSGHQIAISYGASGRIERITDASGRILHLTHNPSGLLVRIVWSRNGRPDRPVMGYAYDAQGNLTAATDGYGNRLTFEHDTAHRIVRRTDRRGFAFEFGYDDAGRCVHSRGADGLLETSVQYTIPRRATRVIRADGGEWQYFFDESGALTQILDPLGGATQYVHDQAGRVIAEVEPDASATTFVFDGEGPPTAKITPQGRRIRLPSLPPEKDPYGHQVASNAAEYEIGNLIDLRRVKLPNRMQAMAASIQYEALRSIVTRDADPKTALDVSFPPSGPQSWPAPETGRTFDDFGHLLHQSDEFGRTRRWRYDANGNPVEYIDFDGGNWSYEIGSWNHRLRTLNPIGAAVRYEFNRLEQATAFVDAGGTRTEYQRDLKDAIVAVVRHGVVRDHYVRDAAGKLMQKLAGDNRVLLQYEYAPGKLPVKRRHGNGEEDSYQYDEVGRYTTVSTARDHVAFEYDQIGNECTDKRNGRGVEHLFRGRRLLAKSTWFGRFNITYQKAGEGILNIVDPAGKKHALKVLPNGLVERRHSNGTIESAQYDSNGRCLFKYLSNRTGRRWHRHYQWSGEGELRQINDNLYHGAKHEYDTAHRLRRRLLSSGKSEEYELDAAGNLLSRAGADVIAVGEGNRISSIAGAPVAYNDRNHIARRSTPAGEVHYHYDSADQLVRVTTPAVTWQADYDALGRRTRKTCAGRTTEYFWNGDQLGAEIDADGRLRLYVYADALALTPLMFLDFDSVDAPLDSARTYFVFSDQIGTPRLVEDDSGNEVWRADVDPYGVAQISQKSRVEFNLRFPGHYWDAEIALNYNRFRYYDPALGRYIQSDPLGLAGGHNLYAYCANPLADVDTRGLACWSDQTKRGLEEKGFVILEEKDCNLVVKSPKGYIYDLTPGDGTGKIRFGQQAVSPEFSSGGRFKGAEIDEVAAQVKSGQRSTDELKVDYIYVNGEKVVVNNRSLTTLSKAGKKPTNTEDQTGKLPEPDPHPETGKERQPDSLPSVLERLDEMDGKPSDSMPVRESSRRDAPIKETVTLPD